MGVAVEIGERDPPGLVGASRLERDLLTDDDGKETPAQRMLEAYFW